jgi:hypothetical protein
MPGITGFVNAGNRTESPADTTSHGQVFRQIDIGLKLSREIPHPNFGVNSGIQAVNADSAGYFKPGRIFEFFHQEHDVLRKHFIQKSGPFGRIQIFVPDQILPV